MGRYVLYSRNLESAAPAPVAAEAASAAARACGATVLGQGSGTVVIEADAALAERIASQLPGWALTAETRAMRVPTPPRFKAL